MAGLMTWMVDIVIEVVATAIASWVTDVLIEWVVCAVREVIAEWVTVLST